jgi:hypothetical protein
MSYNKSILRVCTFASTDETRPQLMYCVHDKASKALVATDGHRAIWDRSLYTEAAKPFKANTYLKTAGKPFKANTYLKTSDMVAPDWEGFKYPAINSFRPNQADYSDPIEFKLPLWFGKLKGYKKQDSKVWFDIDGSMGLTPLPNSACINIALLVPLADETVKMRFKYTRFKYTRDADGNIDKLDPLAPVWIILDNDCDMVVMPLRS